VSLIAAAYRDACVARSFGVPFVEHRYGADPYQSVAIYPSERPNGALLAFVHGGGWTSGYKEWMGFMAPAFAARGITFASIGYRLAPQHLFPPASTTWPQVWPSWPRRRRAWASMRASSCLAATPPAGTTALSWRCAATGRPR